jgi:hypothetical protein
MVCRVRTRFDLFLHVLSFYHTTGSHLWEHSSLRIHWNENLKYHVLCFLLEPAVCSLNANISEQCLFHLHRQAGMKCDCSWECGVLHVKRFGLKNSLSHLEGGSWRVGVGPYMALSQTVPCKDLQLRTNPRTPHHTSTHSFVKPTVTNAAN